jgi:hypothetical protein
MPLTVGDELCRVSVKPVHPLRTNRCGKLSKKSTIFSSFFFKLDSHVVICNRIFYFLPSPYRSSFRRDYLFTNPFPSLSCASSLLFYCLLFFIPVLLQFFQSFSKVSLRQLAQIYLVTIHPCDLFFLLLFYLFSSFRLRNSRPCFFIESFRTAWN